MIGVLDPLPDIAVHVVKAKCVGFPRGHWLCRIFGVLIEPRVIAELGVVIANRPVRIISDLEFLNGFPRDNSSPDYDAMHQALISGIRDGLV